MTEVKNMKNFAVLGPGGVGGLVAGLLARAGHHVTVVATEATAEHITTAGLRVESDVFGDFRQPLAAVPTLRERVDALVLAPKATALGAALERVPAAAVDDALVVPLLNGVAHVDRLREHYPRAHVVAAAIHVESTRVAPGHVRHTSPFASVELARSGVPGDRVAELAAWLRPTGLSVTVGDSAERTLWRKLHLLLPTALVCTHAAAPIGRVRTHRRADLEGAVTEVAAVAEGLGVPLDSAAVISAIDRIPPEMKPSMLRDREAGRPMEIDALGGHLLRTAERVGVATPVTTRLVTELNRLQRGVAGTG